MVTACLMALAAAGCSNSFVGEAGRPIGSAPESGGPAQSGDVVPADPLPQSAHAGGQATEVPPGLDRMSDALDIEKTPDLDRPAPTQWGFAEPVDDTHVRIGFSMGSSTCGAADYTLIENDQTVLIDLVVGLRPGVTACTDDNAYATMLVPLAAPLGDREIKQTRLGGDGGVI